LSGIHVAAHISLTENGALAPPLAFTANDGSDLGSPVWLDYFEGAVRVNGTIGTTTIKYPVASAK
jgi:hypothetical protein